MADFQEYLDTPDAYPGQSGGVLRYNDDAKCRESATCDAVASGGSRFVSIKGDAGASIDLTPIITCLEEIKNAKWDVDLSFQMPKDGNEYFPSGLTTIKEPCLPGVYQVSCDDAGNETVLIGTIQNGEFIPMADTEFAVSGSDLRELKPVKAQVDVSLLGEFSGGGADVLAIEGFPDFDINGTAVTATAADLHSWAAAAMPCGACYLATSGDVSTETEVEVEGTFINDRKVRTKADGEAGGSTLDFAVIQKAGAVSDYCFNFELCIFQDKAGNILNQAGEVLVAAGGEK